MTKGSMFESALRNLPVEGCARPLLMLAPENPTKACCVKAEFIPDAHALSFNACKAAVRGVTVPLLLQAAASFFGIGLASSLGLCTVPKLLAGL